MWSRPAIQPALCIWTVHISRDADGPIPINHNPHMEWDQNLEISDIDSGTTQTFKMVVDFDYSGEYDFSGQVVCSGGFSNEMEKNDYRVDLE